MALVVIGLGAWAIVYAMTQLGLVGGCTVTLRNVGAAELAGVGVRTVSETGNEPTSPWTDVTLRPGEDVTWSRDASSDSHLEVRWVEAAGLREHWRVPVYIAGSRYRAVEVDLAAGRAPEARHRTRPRGEWSEIGPIRRVAQREAPEPGR